MVLDLRLIEYLEYISIAKNFSPLTVDSHKHVLGKFCNIFGQFEPIELDFMRLESWMVDQTLQESIRGKPKSPSTINTERAIIRSFLRYCRTSGDAMNFDPALISNMKVKRKLKHALKHDDIVSVARQIPYDKLRLCILVIFFAGLRIGEVLKLRPRHFHGNCFLIEDSKSYEPRPAFIPQKLADEVWEYIRQNNITDGRIFEYGTQIQSVNYERYTTGGLRKQIQRHFARAGYDINPHDLRHAFATMLHKNGADIYTIKELLGHSDVRTTQIYIHIDNKEMASSHANFSDYSY